MTSERATEILRRNDPGTWTDERIAATSEADILFYGGQTAAEERSRQTMLAALEGERQHGKHEAVDTRPLDDHGRRIGARRRRN